MLSVMAENMILQATELGIASCIISRGYETFENEEGRKLMKEWEVPEGIHASALLFLATYPENNRTVNQEKRAGLRL